MDSTSRILDGFDDFIQEISSSDWEQTLTTLHLHRLTPLVAYKLLNFEILEKLPDPYRSQFKASFVHTQQVNKIFLLTLDAILKTMQKFNVHPVVWKGAMLADSIYPEPGTRIMGDLDFAISPEEMSQATQAFHLLGFMEQDSLKTSDATYFSNSAGVLCDVHHRVRLFEGKETIGLTQNLKPQHMSVDTLPVLEPNALLVHLVVHMDGHLLETGPILQWIVDIAFVLQKWQHQLDLEKIQTLMPDLHSLELLLRIIRFLEINFDCVFPSPLSKAASTLQPLVLTKLLRQRRLIPWHLSKPRSWVKLGASQLGMLSHQEQPLPWLMDWIWVPGHIALGESW